MTAAMVTATRSSTTGRIVRQSALDRITCACVSALWRSKPARWRSSCPKARTTARPESPSAMYVVTCASASLALRHAGPATRWKAAATMRTSGNTNAATKAIRQSSRSRTTTVPTTSSASETSWLTPPVTTVLSASTSLVTRDITRPGLARS